MHRVFCSCGEGYNVTDQHIGRRIQCGRCGNRFEVTGPQAARSGSDPRRSQQQPPPRDPYRDPYRQEPSRNQYREPPRNDPYRGGPPPRNDSYRQDSYRNEPYGNGGQEFADESRDEGGLSMQEIGGFLTPKVRLYLFIACAALALASAALLLATMKPVGNSLPRGGPDPTAGGE